MAMSNNCCTWFEGKWNEGNTAILGAADHGTWHGTLVFDGCRYFEGVAPDLDLHSERIIRSAVAMGMDAPCDAETVQGLIEEGIERFAKGTALYLRPMMWSMGGSISNIDPDPESTAFAICLEELPMVDPAELPMTVSPYRRPHQDTAITGAKAACLYPNNGRVVAEARRRGFKNALTMDLDDHVAETASTNVFMVRDGEVFTPVPNGTFLNGITRQRVIELLRSENVKVTEASLRVEDFHEADEMFLTANAFKVVPVTRFEDRALEGPVAAMARSLYWDYAHSQ